MEDDERIARLQRLAYGAGTPDDVRARAREELTELRAQAANEAVDADGAHAADQRITFWAGNGFGCHVRVCPVVLFVLGEACLALTAKCLVMIGSS